MARPQNGNIQAPFGYNWIQTPTGLRQTQPNSFQYEGVQQIIPQSINGPNYAPPMATHVQASISYPNYPMPTNPYYHNQFSYGQYQPYPPQYVPQTQYIPEVTQAPPTTTVMPTAPTSNASTQRKFQPLVVVDPKSLQDVDLSKFKEVKKSSNNQSLIDSNDLNKNPELPKITEEVKNVEKYQTEIAEKHDIKSSEEELVQSIHKSDSETDHGNDSEADISPNESDIKPDYRLPVELKESDATTLKNKLIYDREYLLSLKKTIDRTKRPSNLPASEEFAEDIILKQPNDINTKLNSFSNNPRTKQYANKQYFNNKKQQRNQKMINLDTRDSVPLLRSKSGYLPPQLRKNEDSVDPMVELSRRIKGNLNKITPQNFQECLEDIQKLGINSSNELLCLINEIFEKAVKEEAYSVTYAQFCNKLAKEFEAKAFKRELLKKCQTMFQTPLMEQLEEVRQRWSEKVENEVDAKIKALLENDSEEQVKKARDSYFGNIRFIGELFLHQLLSEKVIINCVYELLKGSDDTDSMLALCKLLETCGKQIESRHKEEMNKFIQQMTLLSHSSSLETRIRFKLKDVIDMRGRDWALRHIQQEQKIRPKTLEEQKEEAYAEAANKANALSQMNKPKVPVNPPNVRRSIQNSKTPFAIKNLSCSSQSFDDKPVLGPSVRNNWSEGSGPKQQPSKDHEGWTTANIKGRGASMRFGSNSRSREQSPQVKYKNRYRTLESSADCSGPDSRSSTPPIAQPRSVKNISIEPRKTDDEISDIMFQDLLSKNSFNDDTWKQISNVPSVVEKWIDTMMEKDECCRHSVGDNFARLLSVKLISYEQIINGTQEFVNSSDDLLCDIPKLWEFFSQFLERFIQDKASNVNFYNDIFKDKIPNDDVAKCLSMSLHAASSRLGHQIVGQVFHKSTLEWKNIVRSDANAFIKDHSLEFTVHGGVSPLSTGSCSLQSVSQGVDELLTNNKSNEDIFDYLEKNVDKPTWKTSDYVRTISMCILKSLNEKPEAVKRETLKGRKEIIKRILNNKMEHQMELMKCILKLTPEFDRSTLNVIYDVLSTDKILTCPVFKSYLNDESLKSDPNFKMTESIISQLHLSESR